MGTESASGAVSHAVRFRAAGGGRLGLSGAVPGDAGGKRPLRAALQRCRGEGLPALRRARAPIQSARVAPPLARKSDS